MGCIPSEACRAGLDQATAKWPNRNRASDGICGDPSHMARVSDHNVGEAFDLTHDPANGVDCNKIAEQIKDDPRVKYVIWNRRIWNPSISLSWRPYTGSNPHDHHMHVSINAWDRNNTSNWYEDITTGDEFTIMDKQTKEYLDTHFNGVRQAQRRARETQLLQGERIVKILKNLGLAQEDIDGMEADLKKIRADLRDDGE